MKKKIIHIITRLELGGAQKNTLYTVENLDKEKFDVLLISGKGGILDDEAKKLNTIFLDCLVREISPLKDLKAFIKIYKIIKKEKPDIVHTHSSKAGIIGRFAAYFAGVKNIIHTYHGFGFHNYQNIIIKLTYILIEKLASSFTKRIIFVSNENIKIAKKYRIGNPLNYTLVRSGIKMCNFKKEKDYSFLKEYGIEKRDSIIISTVANFKPQKNPDDFFDIASKIIKDGYDVYFIYAGGGERLEYFKEKAKKEKIENRLIFTGWIESPWKVYNSSDIFLLTSLWEGLPRSLVEAMVCGVVPVCYKTDGVMDLITSGVNGFMVEQKNKKEMIDILINLIKDKSLYNRIRENLSRESFLEFDIDFMVKRQEEIYLSL